SSPNLAALALVLAAPPRDEGDADRAATAARAALDEASGEDDLRYAADSACKIAVALHERELLARCWRELSTIARGKASTHFYLAHAALLDARAEDAQKELDRAQTLGLPKDQAREVQRRINLARPRRSPLDLAGPAAIGW